MKFSIKDFFSKCDQIRRKSLMENFIFCAVKDNNDNGNNDEIDKKNDNGNGDETNDDNNQYDNNDNNNKDDSKSGNNGNHDVGNMFKFNVYVCC